MRRERRVNNNDKKIKEKITMYSIIGVSALVVILVGLLIYSKSLSDNVQNGTMNLEKIAKQNEENLTGIELLQAIDDLMSGKENDDEER